LWAGVVHAQVADEAPIAIGKLRFKFATVDAAQATLATPDEFLNRLSDFDIKSRMQRSDPASLEEYVAFVAREVRDWKPSQIEKVSSVLNDLNPKLATLQLTQPIDVLMIQTSGREESGAAYTRSGSIILTATQIEMPKAGLGKLILHELFHVLSRRDPVLRDKLYAIIGFQKTTEILLPKEWMSRRITNPDAPVIEHVIRVQISAGQQQIVAPVLYSSGDYDPATASSMFAYLQFGLMQVENSGENQYQAVLRDGQPVMHPTTLPDFRRQIGANTQYIIHPEEVLADNFSEWILGTKDLPDPWIPQQIEAVFADLVR
jgi:hypothetical protein